jgi:L-rhamnose mutarotase
MKEVAFKMKLKAGFEKEYQKRHDEIWPEMVTVLKNAGVYDYSIYLDKESNTLFAVQKLTDDNTADKLQQNEIVRQWWEYMGDIMEVNPDKSPVEVELKKVFHMD